MLHIKMPSKAHRLSRARAHLRAELLNPHPSEEQHRHSIYHWIGQIRQIIDYHPKYLAPWTL